MNGRPAVPQPVGHGGVLRLQSAHRVGSGRSATGFGGVWKDAALRWTATHFPKPSAQPSHFPGKWDFQSRSGGATTLGGKAGHRQRGPTRQSPGTWETTAPLHDPSRKQPTCIAAVSVPDVSSGQSATGIGGVLEDFPLRLPASQRPIATESASWGRHSSSNQCGAKPPMA